MKADIFNIDKFVKVNNLQEITNPLLLDKYNVPEPDGLLSFEIFGRTSYDRTYTWAYFDLHGHFINPLIYRTWLRIDRKIEEVVAGSTYVNINNKGELIVSDEEHGWTGLEELYKHYDQIKFKDKDSVSQSLRIKALKNVKKEEAFLTKMIVCPPFFRDIKLSDSNNGSVSIHEYTDAYSKILRLTQSLKLNTFGFDVIGNMTRYKIQNLIVDFYQNITKNKIFTKEGHFRKYVMGKSIDNCARLVITAPVFNKNKPDEMIESFEYCGLPLAATVTCFYPFILKWLKDYFNKEFVSRKDNYPIFDNITKKIKYYRLNTNHYNDDYFNGMINTFIHSPGNRFDEIEIVCVDKDTGETSIRNVDFVGDMTDIHGKNIKNHVVRKMTLTDILYRAAVSEVKNKHCNITRYPIEDYFGTFFVKIHVVATIETTPMIINGEYYPNYPVVSLDNINSEDEIGNLFRDSLTMSNLYLTGLGKADYDGDQVTVKGVWSEEANAEAEKIIYSVKNLLNINNVLNRDTTRDAIQALYTMTK